MSQPPYPPHSPEPHPGHPGSGAPQGYPPPGYSAPPPPPGPPPGNATPPFGTPAAEYGTAPQYGTPAPQHGTQAPQYGTQAPQHGAQAPQYDAQAPQHGAQAPQYGAAQALPPGAPAPKKSSALRIALIAAAVVAVLCVGGIGVAVFAARDTVKNVVEAASITVVEPATLAGREKITDPAVAGGLSSLDTELGKVPGATGSVSGLYGDVTKQDLVMVAAASSITGSPQERFDEFTNGMSTGGMQLSNLTDTDPGPLGGIAKCGDSSGGGAEMAICVWSDNGSIGMFAMMFKPKADLEKEFVSMRGQVEQKG